MRALLMLGALAAVAGAQGTVEEALKAYEAGDHAKALSIFRPLAEQGDARAMDMVGHMLRSGQGVARDDKAAVAWFQKAAAKEYAPAIRNLGEMMMGGRGIAKDEPGGVQLILKAANAGDMTAEAYAGMFYAKGRGVKANSNTAKTYLERAARKGLPAAQFMLGQLLASGRVGRNLQNPAVEWIGRAAAGGHEQALGLIHTLVDKQKHPIACYSLGVMLIEGTGVKKDPERGEKLLAIALKADYGEAHWYMGERYLHGLGVEKDIKLAKGHFARAAARGSPAGWYRHGLMTMQSKGNFFSSAKEEGVKYVLKSARMRYQPAIDWLKAESDKGDPLALAAYAEIVPTSEKAALLTRAAEKGNRNAMNHLGHLHVGAGRYEEGVKWFTMAAEKGHKDSALWLARDADKGKRFREAFKWWSMVKTATGHFEVGARLEAGRGVEANKRKAALRYWDAGRLGHATALTRLAGLVQLLPAAEKDALIKRAAELRKRLERARKPPIGVITEKNGLNHCAAELGDEPSMLAHGISLSFRRGSNAPKYLTPAAEAGNGRAAYWLGYFYRGEKKWDPAFRFTKLAAETGHPGGCSALAKMYFHGQGTEKDHMEARAWATASRILSRGRQMREWAKWYRSLGVALGDKKDEADALGKQRAEKLKPKK